VLPPLCRCARRAPLLLRSMRRRRSNRIKSIQIDSCSSALALVKVKRPSLFPTRECTYLSCHRTVAGRLPRCRRSPVALSALALSNLFGAPSPMPSPMLQGWVGVTHKKKRLGGPQQLAACYAACHASAPLGPARVLG
jgi:hypothetical protein